MITSRRNFLYTSIPKFFLGVAATISILSSAGCIDSGFNNGGKNPDPIPTEWQTYTNAQYGFSQQYPSNYTVEEERMQ